jgi:hypothetical protein
LAALENIGEIDDVLRAFLEEQVVAISQQLRPKHQTLKAEHIWKILSPFVTLDGTKEPISTEVISDKVKNTVENSQADLTAALIELLVKSKIIRYLETNETYEIAHDSLAAKIADKRTDEEIALLEVKRLIKSQAALKADAQELFTEKQLNFIEPYLTKLTLETAEKTLIEKSRAAIVAAKIAEKTEQEAELKVAQAQAEKDRQLREKAENASKKARLFSRIAIAIAILAVLAGVYAWQQSQAATIAKTEAQKSLRQSYQSDISRYEREIKLSEQNIKSYEQYKAENDVIDLEKNKIDSLQTLVKDINIEIQNLKK